MQAGSEEAAQPDNIDVSALPLPDTSPPGPLLPVPALGDWLTPCKPVTVRRAWMGLGAVSRCRHVTCLVC